MPAICSQLGVSQTNAFTHVAPFYDSLMTGVPYDYWTDYLEQLFSRHGISPRSVLDIGCGTGAVTLELAKRGYICHGVDISESMLTLARNNAAKAALAIEYTQQDASDLTLTGRRFEAIVSLFDSLNNILDPLRLAEAFQRAHHHLSSPGVLIFDVNTEYAFETGMFNQRSTPADGPLQYVWRSEYDAVHRLCTVNMTFRIDQPDGSQLGFEEKHLQRAYSKDEIFAMLEKAGFDSLWCYDAYTFKATRKRSDRIFFVAGRGLTARPVYVDSATRLRRHT